MRACDTRSSPSRDGTSKTATTQEPGTVTVYTSSSPSAWGKILHHG